MSCKARWTLDPPPRRDDSQNPAIIHVKRSAKKKVAFLGTRYGELAVEHRLLRPFAALLVQAQGQSEAEIINAAHDAQVIVCGGAPKITAAVLRRLPTLKAVVRAGIGIDSIDIEACTRRGIYVVNVPDYCVEEVATHTLTLILSWARKIPASQLITSGGDWNLAPLKPLQSARDLVLGLVGFGRIAQRLCHMARAVGFQVMATDPYVAKSRIHDKGARPVSLNALIRLSDFVTLHLPLSAKTRHIINAERIAKMKRTAYLVNTARGELIDQKALTTALKRGRLAGAALDVMEPEPPTRNHPLRTMENLILTPHCAWYTERSQDELRRRACSEVSRVLRGEVPRNVVNRETMG